MIQTLEVTEERFVLKEPPSLTVSVGEENRAEAGKVSFFCTYRPGRQ